ncbi:MAG: hypothetical protein HXK12_01035 [Actinomyces sp.]|nr:hypothetical protein [Actinomyces sp.]
MAVCSDEEVKEMTCSERIQARGYTRAKKLWRIGFHQEIPYDLLREMIQLNIAQKADYTRFWR